jgi:hypothetical protein
MKRNPLSRNFFIGFFLTFLLMLSQSACASRAHNSPGSYCEPPPTAPAAAATQGGAATQPADGQWISLFDGKTLGKWKPGDYAGGGEPAVEDGKLMLPFGERLTGVTWTGGDVPKANYEISLQAQRVDGTDFFCGLTFPVGDSHGSLIIGGWGGALCGISSIDGDDAAHNDAKSFQTFKNGQWYTIRLRVTPNKIQAWLDKEKIIDLDTTGKKITLRADIEDSKPLGLSSFQSTAAIRDIRLKKLSDDRAPAK